MYKMLLKQLNLSLWVHVDTSVVVYHMNIHSNSRDPVFLICLWATYNQASQEETCRTGGRFPVWEPREEGSFQVISLGLLAGGPLWGWPPVHVSEANNGCSWVNKVNFGWTKGGNCLQDPVKFLQGGFTLCVGGWWVVWHITKCSSKTTTAHFLSFLSCFPSRSWHTQ